MQMFDNFENQPKDYIPNNMFPMPIVQWLEVNNDTVRPIYRNCKLVGYEWNWGDKVSITIKNQIKINIPEYAIYTYEDVDPTEETVGTFVGQKYYNLHNLTSYTLSMILDKQDGSYDYIWDKDERLTFPNIGTETLEVPISLGLGEQIVVQLFNFRKEKIEDWVYYEPEFTWELSPEESLKLPAGIYFLNVHLETRLAEEEEMVSTNLRLTNAYEIVVKGF